MSSLFGLADLQVTDDLNVAMDPETYKDAPTNVVPQPGAYTFRVLAAKARTDRDGNQVLADGKYPTIVLEQLEIVEPEGDARKFNPFIDVRTKPVKRLDGFSTDLADIIRAFDQNRGFSGLMEGLSILSELSQDSTFRAQIGWSAYDSTYAKAELAAAGLEGVKFADMTADQREVANRIYKAARKTTKDFPVSNGKRIPVTTGLSGETLEARVTIQRYIPSGAENVKLGAFVPKG